MKILDPLDGTVPLGFVPLKSVSACRGDFVFDAIAPLRVHGAPTGYQAPRTETVKSGIKSAVRDREFVVRGCAQSLSDISPIQFALPQDRQDHKVKDTLDEFSFERRSSMIGRHARSVDATKCRGWSTRPLQEAQPC